MADMLVKLYEIDENRELYRELSEKGIHIKRALGLDASFVCDFIEKEKFSKRWVDECRAAFSAQPSACYIAVKNGEVIGFCCYDASGKGEKAGNRAGAFAKMYAVHEGGGIRLRDYRLGG